MKIVIDIPEAVYKCVMDGTYCGTLYEELKNGVPVDTSGDYISREAAEQPEKRTEERTETHACDCIDIDKAIEHYEGTLETLKGIDLEVRDGK